MKDEKYYFHQTPKELVKILLDHVPCEEGQDWYEPFKGEGAFYNAFNDKDARATFYSEIEEGKDFRDFEYEEPVDWVVSNPPYANGKELSFWDIHQHFVDDMADGNINKGICWLVNDKCFTAFTPKRLEWMEKRGVYLYKIVVCNIQKWRGRQYFLILKKKCCGKCVDDAKHEGCCAKNQVLSKSQADSEGGKKLHGNERFDFFDFIPGYF